jgi:hypothetical protein
MTDTFDQFPVYDPIIKNGSSYLSDVWAASFSSFYENLLNFVNANGFYLPTLTTAERDSIESPTPGQMIYNTTINSAQYFKLNAWVSF